ncbi:MAG: DUF1080 domain-containing protein, partial [Lysobacteraceae bacterium]
MVTMTKAILCLAVVSMAPTIALAREAAPNTMTARERAAGWQLLFNGRDLDGWRSFDGGAPSPSWVVRD